MTAAAWRFESRDANDALHRRDDFAAALEAKGRKHYDAFAAALIYGELLTNFVKHAPGPVSIELAFDGSDAVLTVTDSGGGFVPHVGLPQDVYSESGRGLCIVRELSKHFTIQASRRAGTSVRVVLPDRAFIAGPAST